MDELDQKVRQSHDLAFDRSSEHEIQKVAEQTLLVRSIRKPPERLESERPPDGLVNVLDVHELEKPQV